MAEGGALRELAALFSIEVEDEALEKFDKKVEGITGRIVAAGKLIVEALALEAVKEFFEQQIEGAAHLQDLATKLGVAAGELNAFQFAAKTAGIDADTAAASIGHLNKVIGAALIQPGGDEASLLAKLGLKPKELTDAKGNIAPLESVLGKVAERFSALKTQPERAAYAFELFGKQGQAILPILAQGKEKLQELFAEEAELGDGLGDDFPRNAKEAEEATNKFNYAVQSLKNRITAEVLPSIIRFYGWAKNLVVQIIAFDKRTHALSTILTFLAVVAGVRVFGALKKVVEVLGLGRIGVEKFLSAFKVAGPIALLYALYLILDDISAWARGGDSLIGRTLAKFEGAKGAQDTLENLQKTLHEISDDATTLTASFGSFLGLGTSDLPKQIGLWNALGLSIHGVVTVLEALYHLLGIVRGLGEGAINAAGNVAALNTPGAGKDLQAGAAKAGQSGRSLLTDLGIRSSDKDLALASGASNQGAFQAAGLDTKVGAAYAHAGIDPSFHIGAGQSAKDVLAKLRASQVGGGRGEGGRSIQQKTQINVNVAGGRNPKETGQIVGQGVATEVEKENARTLDAIMTP